MRMKMVCDDRTLREVVGEFLALKKTQKVRERTLSDYKKQRQYFQSPVPFAPHASAVGQN